MAEHYTLHHTMMPPLFVDVSTLTKFTSSIERSAVILLASLCFILASLLAVCIYRTTFHPLASFPGPSLARLTSGYAAYHSAKGDLHLDIQRCHEVYGPVVRYGPNRLIFSSTRAMYDIYNASELIQKSNSYLTMVPWKNGWTVFSCTDKSMHKQMRKTLQSGLSPRSLQSFEQTSINNIDTLVGLVTEDAASNEAQWSSPKDMTLLNKWLAIDSMSALAFGRNIGLLTNPSIRYIVDCFDFYTWRTGFFEQWPRLWSTGVENLLLLMAIYSPITLKFARWRSSYTNAAIDSNNETRMGVFSSIARSSVADEATGRVKDRYQYPRSQMEAEGSFLLLSATDTNATTMSAALFYLSRYPDTYARLQQEVFEVFADGGLDEIRSGSKLNGCTYLGAVINEVLRMHPPSPGVPWREIVGKAGMVIDGTHIPTGTDVGSCIYAIQNDANIFREPKRFWPERWLPGTLPEGELKAANAANKPFSLGPRNCAGKQVAMNELRLALARIMHQCDFRPAEGELGKVGEGEGKDSRVFEFQTHFTAMTQGPWLEFKRREVS